MDEPPPILEYARPPASRGRAMVARTCVLFGMALLMFGCCILGGYLGHILAPGPNYSVDFEIDLPAGTTPQNSSGLAASLTEIQPPMLANTLHQQGIRLQEDPIRLGQRVWFMASCKRPDPRLYIGFTDKSESVSWDGASALASRLDAVLTANGQEHAWSRLKDPSRQDDPLEKWFIGGGVVLALALLGLLIWRFNTYLLPGVPPLPQTWENHGRPA